MQKSFINRTKISYFSNISNDLVYQQEKFKDLLQFPFSLENFEGQIELKNKQYDEKTRTILVDSLVEKYSKIKISEKVKFNIDLLKLKKTFTITTGHQLCLFTGPIYFIFKILHTIKLCEILKKEYPKFNFVPIYWMASEDHDFEEVNHLNLFNQKITWETDQEGAVGNFNLDGLVEIKEQIKSFFKNVDSKEITDLLNFYEGKNLGEATFNFINELFKEYGLIVIDANQRLLKELFIPILEKEITTSFSENNVGKSNLILEDLKIKPQVFSRPINLFYLNENSRTRIIPEQENFYIENKGIYSKSEILSEIRNFPERFSPNVILRPLYQETILPNLAYIGGGGELAYWLQLKNTFDEAGVLFPLIQVRNSIQIFDKNIQKKIQKLDFLTSDFFKELEQIKQIFLHQNLKDEIDFSELEIKSSDLMFELEQLILRNDPNLMNFVLAEKTKISNQIENIKAKLIKQQKAKFDVSLKQIEDIKRKLFPQNGLQERHDNFLNFCADGNYKGFIQGIYDVIDPFEKDMILVNI
jgi:bacillithiol biosynthesis cysteine-adding enzyme BshC